MHHNYLPSLVGGGCDDEGGGDGDGVDGRSVGSRL